MVAALVTVGVCERIASRSGLGMPVGTLMPGISTVYVCDLAAGEEDEAVGGGGLCGQGYGVAVRA